jgi:hypothetical protein
MDIKKRYTIGKYFTPNGDTINGLSSCDLIGSLRNPLKSYLILLTIHQKPVYLRPMKLQS